MTSKQQLAFDNLKAAIEEAGKTFEGPIETKGKRTLVKNNGTPITIGPNGGYDIPTVSTYLKSDLETMVRADELERGFK